jgi:PAS domain S-box-containing protein
MLNWNPRPKTPSSAKILIVYGDEAVLRLIEESLQREGYTCARATTGNAALIALSEQPPDLMLVDLNLPDISGQELIDRQEKSGTAVPFIVIAARGDEPLAVEIMNRGALGYLVKDTQLVDLLPSVVRRVLQEIEQHSWLAAAEVKQARLTSQLRAERQRFTDLLASVPGVLWETLSGPTTGNQRIIFVSDYVEKLLGYSVQQWLSKTNFWLIIVHPEDRRRVAREAATIFSGGEGGVIRSRMIAKNEEVVWVESQIVVIRDAEGQPVGTRGVSMDITERRWNELRRNLQYVTSRALAESATLAKAAPRILKALCGSFGWSLGELWQVDRESKLLRYATGWYPPLMEFDEFKAVSRTTAFPSGTGLPGRVWATGKSVWIADIVNDPGFLRSRAAEAAKERMHSAFAYPVMLNGEVLGVLTFFARDVRESTTPDVLQIFSSIGAQIAQFMERRRAEKSLKAEHHFTSAVLETLAALVVVTDRNGRIVQFNHACERFTGFSFEDVRGKHYRELMLLEELTSVRHFFEMVEAGDFPAEHESYCRTSDGSHRCVAWSKTVLRDQGGVVECVVGTGIDVTERKRLEREVLEVSENEQRRIGQDLHDDLCQRLAGIQLMGDVLQRDLLAKAKSEAEQAAMIAVRIRDAIAHTRMLARGLSPVALDSNGLMASLQELAENSGKLFQISCEFRFDGCVAVDDNAVATHLYRIAQEAVTNAVKHGRAKEVVIRLAESEDKCSLSISDDGLGLPDTPAKNQGTGLRIMKYRAATIGASLKVCRAGGRGTCVSCSFFNQPRPKDR